MEKENDNNLDVKPYFIEAIVKYAFDNRFVPAIIYDDGKNNFITIELNPEYCFDFKIEKNYIKFFYEKIEKEVIILIDSIVSVFVVENNVGMSFVHSSFMNAITDASKKKEKTNHLKVIK